MRRLQLVLQHDRVTPEAETSSYDASRDTKGCLLLFQKATWDGGVKNLPQWRGEGQWFPQAFRYSSEFRDKSRSPHA